MNFRDPKVGIDRLTYMERDDIHMAREILVRLFVKVPLWSFTFE